MSGSDHRVSSVSDELFDFENITISPDTLDFSRKTDLGSGTFADVYKVPSADRGDVAVKVFKSRYPNRGRKEACLQCTLKDDHVLQLLGVCQLDTLLLVLELMHGSLLQFRHNCLERDSTNVPGPTPNSTTPNSIATQDAPGTNSIVTQDAPGTNSVATQDAPNTIAQDASFVDWPFSYDDVFDNASDVLFTHILEIALQLAKGCEYLHSQDVIHCDLKLANVLMEQHFNQRNGNRELCIKVSDFGESQRVSGPAYCVSGNIGTVITRAPESHRYTLIPKGEGARGNDVGGHGFEPLPNGDPRHYFSSDVYSFGIILWELASGEEVWGNNDEMTIVRNVLSGKRPPMPDQNRWKCSDRVWQDFVGLIERCWSGNKDDRPTFADIVQILEELKARACSESDAR